MHNRKLISIIAILFLSVNLHSVCAQSVKWSVDFNTVFDNREGDRKYTATKTYFRTQLAPEIGLRINDEHSIAGGAVWNQPIGCEWEDYKISPTLYYRFSGMNGWRFSFGMFPRTQLIQQMQDYIWSDVNYYNQRNIRGVLIQYQKPDGYFETVVDWRGMQTKKQRESFNVIARGEWNKPGKVLLTGGVAMMNHLALQEDAPEDQYIVDHFIVNPYVGVNLETVTPLDSFTIKAGPLMSMIRNRADRKWKVPCGGWLEIVGEWKWLGLKNTFYAGKELSPYYTEFGEVLDQGESFYASKFYNRTDVYAYVFRNSFLNLQASLDFVFAEDNFTFYQKLLLRVYFDEKLWKNRKNLSKAEQICNIY